MGPNELRRDLVIAAQGHQVGLPHALPILQTSEPNHVLEVPDSPHSYLLHQTSRTDVEQKTLINKMETDRKVDYNFILDNKKADVEMKDAKLGGVAPSTMKE